ncbi:rRNA N-glycosidase [Hordeum vulgare]|nr:rRNA N-glycosidase [Hordeum vulgare]
MVLQHRSWDISNCSEPSTLSLLMEAGNQHVNAAKKVALAVLIVMFFEGPRFPDMCQLGEDLLSSSGLNRIVGAANRRLINNWCKISKAFYHATGNDRNIIISHASSQIVKDVKKGFRILCRTEWEDFLAKLSEATASAKSRASSNKSKK